MPALLIRLGLEQFLYPVRSPSDLTNYSMLHLERDVGAETWICEQLIRRLHQIRKQPVTYEGLTHLKTIEIH